MSVLIKRIQKATVSNITKSVFLVAHFLDKVLFDRGFNMISSGWFIPSYKRIHTLKMNA